MSKSLYDSIEQPKSEDVHRLPGLAGVEQELKRQGLTEVTLTSSDVFEGESPFLPKTFDLSHAGLDGQDIGLGNKPLYDNNKGLTVDDLEQKLRSSDKFDFERRMSFEKDDLGYSYMKTITSVVGKNGKDPMHPDNIDDLNDYIETLCDYNYCKYNDIAALTAVKTSSELHVQPYSRYQDAIVSDYDTAIMVGRKTGSLHIDTMMGSNGVVDLNKIQYEKWQLLVKDGVESFSQLRDMDSGYESTIGKVADLKIPSVPLVVNGYSQFESSTVSSKQSQPIEFDNSDVTKVYARLHTDIKPRSSQRFDSDLVSNADKAAAVAKFGDSNVSSTVNSNIHVRNIMSTWGDNDNQDSFGLSGPSLPGE